MKPQTPKPKPTPKIVYNRVYAYSRKVLILDDYKLCATYDFNDWICVYNYESVAKFHSIKDAVLAYLASYEGVSEIRCTEEMFKIGCILTMENGEKVVLDLSNEL